MLPLGSAPLIAMRKSGHAPDATVWVSYGDFPDPQWHKVSPYLPELIVGFNDPIERLDLRCLVKLPVTLYLKRYDDKAARLFERLKDYASEIVCLSPDFDDDLGFWWLPGRYAKRTIDYDKRRIVTEYEALHDERNQCAYRNKTAEYAEAAARQAKLLEENPWLRC